MIVTPAQAGVQKKCPHLDSRLRGMTKPQQTAEITTLRKFKLIEIRPFFKTGLFLDKHGAIPYTSAMPLIS